MPSNHLISCHPLLLLPSMFPSVRVFSSGSTLCIRWPKDCGFSFSTSPSSEYSELISFRVDWLDLLAVQGTLRSFLQHHSSLGLSKKKNHLKNKQKNLDLAWYFCQFMTLANQSEQWRTALPCENDPTRERRTGWMGQIKDRQELFDRDMGIPRKKCVHCLLPSVTTCGTFPWRKTIQKVLKKILKKCIKSFFNPQSIASSEPTPLGPVILSRFLDIYFSSNPVKESQAR